MQKRSSTDGPRPPRRAYLLLLLLLVPVAVGALATIVLSTHAQGRRELPPLKDLGKYGCQIDGIVQGGQRHWQVHVWAEHNGARGWNQLYATRGKRKQALKDCGEWMDKMDKAIAPPNQKKTKDTTFPLRDAAPPCFYFKSCRRTAHVEKVGKSLCRPCAERLKGREYPPRKPSLRPLYASAQEAREALDMVEGRRKPKVER